MFNIFQFHKGTIRTKNINEDTTSKVLFQFHKGTIRTWVGSIFTIYINYFNSIKVRLELTEPSAFFVKE